ncbi:MAG TPA: sugar ABC transporter permease [Tepidisphaeraceae bacterium]|nr:sugar ABC transporter permease [Tepidisphaeraceae bacterium]
MISRRLWNLQYRLAPYLFVAPFVLLFLVFLLYPLIRSLILSFCNAVGPQEIYFTGSRNYVHLIRDPYFWMAAANTTLYVLAFLLIQVPLSLGLAILLNNPVVRWRTIFRFALISTHLVGHVFVAVVFSQLLDPRHGPVTRLVAAVTGGSIEIPWLTNPLLARASVLMAWLWMSVGYGMIYLLAALQAVDQNLYEAAEMDGATGWSRFWHVTLPGIRPVLTFLILVGLIGGFQLFELPFVLLQGAGPGSAGLTIVMYLFNTGFLAGNLGYASTIGWALVAILIVVSVLQLWLTRAAATEEH